jgi:hypothetical protein
MEDVETAATGGEGMPDPLTIKISVRKLEETYTCEEDLPDAVAQSIREFVAEQLGGAAPTPMEIDIRRGPKRAARVISLADALAKDAFVTE